MTKFISWLLICGVLFGFWIQPEKTFASAKLKYPAPKILDVKYELRDETAVEKAEDGSTVVVSGLVTVINYIHMYRASFDSATKELIETDPDSDPDDESNHTDGTWPVSCEDDATIADCPFSGYYEMEDVYVVLKWTDRNGQLGLFHRIDGVGRDTLTQNGGNPEETINLYELTDEYYECPGVSGNGCAGSWNNPDTFADNYSQGKFTKIGDDLSGSLLRVEQIKDERFNYERVVSSIDNKLCQSSYTPHLEGTNSDDKKVNLNVCENKDEFASFKTQSIVNQKNNKLRRGFIDAFNRDWGSYIYVKDADGGNSDWINYYIRDINLFLHTGTGLSIPSWPKDPNSQNSYTIPNIKLTDLASLQPIVDYCNQTKPANEADMTTASQLVQPVSQMSAFGSNPRERIKNFAVQLMEGPTTDLLKVYQQASETNHDMPTNSPMLDRLKDPAFINQIVPDEIDDKELYQKFYMEGYEGGGTYPDRYPRLSYINELRDFYLQATHTITKESFKVSELTKLDDIVQEDESVMQQKADFDKAAGTMLSILAAPVGAAVGYAAIQVAGAIITTMAAAGLTTLTASAATGPGVIVGVAVAVVCFAIAGILLWKAHDEQKKAEEQYNGYLNAYLRILLTEFYVWQNTLYRKCIDAKAPTDAATQNHLAKALYSKESLRAVNEMAQDVSADEQKARQIGEKLANQIFQDKLCGSSTTAGDSWRTDIFASMVCSTGLLLSRSKYSVEGLINTLLRAVNSWRDGALGIDDDEDDTDTP